MRTTQVEAIIIPASTDYEDEEPVEYEIAFVAIVGGRVDVHRYRPQEDGDVLERIQDEGANWTFTNRTLTRLLDAILASPKEGQLHVRGTGIIRWTRKRGNVIRYTHFCGETYLIPLRDIQQLRDRLPNMIVTRL